MVAFIVLVSILDALLTVYYAIPKALEANPLPLWIVAHTSIYVYVMVRVFMGTYAALVCKKHSDLGMGVLLSAHAVLAAMWVGAFYPY